MEKLIQKYKECLTDTQEDIKSCKKWLKNEDLWKNEGFYEQVAREKKSLENYIEEEKKISEVIDKLNNITFEKH